MQGPEVEELVRTSHTIAAAIAATAVPASITIIPRAPCQRCQAAMLFLWVLLGALGAWGPRRRPPGGSFGSSVGSGRRCEGHRRC